MIQNILLCVSASPFGCISLCSSAKLPMLGGLLFLFLTTADCSDCTLLSEAFLRLRLGVKVWSPFNFGSFYRKQKELIKLKFIMTIIFSKFSGSFLDFRWNFVHSMNPLPHSFTSLYCTACLDKDVSRYGRSTPH